MWIVCITSVRHVLTVNGYGGRQTKENEKSWCFKGWETLVNNLLKLATHKLTKKTWAYSARSRGTTKYPTAHTRVMPTL